MHHVVGNYRSDLFWQTFPKWHSKRDFSHASQDNAHPVILPMKCMLVSFSRNCSSCVKALTCVAAGNCSLMLTPNSRSRSTELLNYKEEEIITEQKNENKVNTLQGSHKNLRKKFHDFSMTSPGQNPNFKTKNPNICFCGPCIKL